MPLFHSKSDGRSNADVFFSYYSRLLEWALQLTHHDRTEAEDLVHDLYIRVVRIARPMAEIENLDSYLFKVLRNLYYSRLRRAGRDPINNLSIVDYDSVELGLAAADRRELLFVRSHLREICSYACRRKGTNRSAGILILRFFLGYYPSELTKIVRVPRHVVDQALHVARSEARTYLKRPNAMLPFSLGKQVSVSFGEGKDVENSQGLFRNLREAVFSASEGECFGYSALAQRYSATENHPPLTAQELAHLVSCPVCLDQVNEILHLPLLEERSPEYGLDRDGSSGPGQGMGGGAANSAGSKRHLKNVPSLRKMERRARDLFEHRPKNLQIVVDGKVWTSQKITAEVNELSLRLPRKDEPPFIEVISEQGQCMVFLQVEAPVSISDLEQVETAFFSDDRSLVLTISFTAGGAFVHVLYRDPLVAEAAAYLDGDNVDGIEATEPRSFAVTALYHPERWVWRWRNNRSVWMSTIFEKFFIRYRGPLLASAAFLAVGIFIGFQLWHQTIPSISADAFLQRAEAAERVELAPGKSEVVSEKVRIRTASQTIERMIRRDTSGRRKPKPQPLDKQTVTLKAKLTGAGVNWDEPLSATTFEDWHKHSHVTRDSVQETGSTLLTLTTTIADSNVTEESLIVRASDFHPVVRTISFRDSGNVEIAELDFSVMPWSAADQGWFEPVAKAAVSDVPGMHAAIHLPHMLSDLELDEAELAAQMVLHQLHADTDEQISLVRGTSGIDVKGIVDTNARRRELLSHLASIPNVHASILSVEEIGSRSPSRSAPEDQQLTSVYSVQAQPSPLEQYLREKNLPMNQLEPVSENLVDGSLRMIQSEAHLYELQSRFEEVSRLPADEQAQLEKLSRSYMEAVTAGIYANQQILLSLGFARSSPVPETSIHDGTGQSIDEQLRQYRQLCLEMVSNETGQGRPAPEIAREILSAGERIRLHLADKSATGPPNNN